MPEIKSTKYFDAVGLSWSRGIYILKSSSSCLFSLAKIENCRLYVEMRIVVVEYLWDLENFSEGKAQSPSAWCVNSTTFYE